MEDVRSSRSRAASARRVCSMSAGRLGSGSRTATAWSSLGLSSAALFAATVLLTLSLLTVSLRLGSLLDLFTSRFECLLVDGVGKPSIVLGLHKFWVRGGVLLHDVGLHKASLDVLVLAQAPVDVVEGGLALERGNALLIDGVLVTHLGGGENRVKPFVLGGGVGGDHDGYIFGNVNGTEAHLVFVFYEQT